jgi:LysM repeat protein
MSSDHTKTLAFIGDYRSFTALWDVNHKDYTNKIKRNDALYALVTNYKMSVKEVKNKIKSPRSYFAKEHQKVTEKKVAWV